MQNNTEISNSTVHDINGVSIIVPDTISDLESNEPIADNNCGSVFFQSIVILIIFFPFIILSLTQLIMNDKYHNELQCSSLVTPYNWMIIEASVTLNTIFFELLSLIIHDSKNICPLMNCISPKMICFFPKMIGIFHMTWLIIGSIVFWHDCMNSMPKPMNVLFWITLISSWLLVHNSLTNINNYFHLLLNCRWFWSTLDSIIKCNC